ncbi:MAG: MBL fold metallo-hydrolase [Verrucomicrobiales bacterium]
MIIPTLKDEALLEDIGVAPEDPSRFHLWWLGQSGFLLKWQNRHLLLDPYLSDSLTAKYAGTDKPHVRMTERCLDPARLVMVDVVTSSHNHTDHLDAATLQPLATQRPGLPLVLPAANIEFARNRLGEAPFAFTGLDAGQSTEVAGFTFTGVPAAHNTIEKDAHGRCHFLGFVVRFGGFTLYHSGDTLWHDQLPHLLIHYQPDVVLVPINGHDPARGVAGNLNGTEAAALARCCGAQLAIPHHFDMFTFNTATPEEFTAACGRLSQPNRVLRCGERLTWASEATG